MDTSANEIGAVHSNDGDWMEVTPGEIFKIRTSASETDGVYTMLEIIADPRNGVPMHVHANEEECFVVLEGNLHLTRGEDRLNLFAGDAATVRRNTPHAWCNLSHRPVRFLVIFSPGAMEKAFRRIGSMTDADFSAISETAEGDGSTIVGPPPYGNIYSILSPRPGP